MPFGLKNAGATYQRLVDKAFQKQIDRNLEVYVDDLVIKSRTEKEVIRDTEETFKTLREINMKLNPQKCAFGMREGTFRGYKVDADGLRVCPDKVEAVLSLPSPKCLKDVQKQNRKLASLNRFMSKSAKKSLSFFKTLKKCTKKSDFQWTAKAEMVFKQMEKLISVLTMLTAPKEKEDLIMYQAAAKEAISAVLMTERDGKQTPIYFVSRALQDPEVNYTPIEKLILAIVKEHDIHYRPRTPVKGQILADFIVERPEDDPLDTPMEDKEELPDPWVLFMDESSCIDGSGAGLIITNPKGMEFTYALRFRFNATNNEAKYEALIAGLRIAEQMGVKNLQANVDSRLVANQVNGIYVAKEPGLIKYLEKFRPPKQASTCRRTQGKINRCKGGTSGSRGRRTHMVNSNLRVPHGGNSSRRKKEGKSYTRKADMYAVTNRILYRKSFLGPWLRCVGPLQANYVLREIHKGSCSMHAGPRSMVAKALRPGYYWSTMHTDARNLIRECSSCQVYRPVPRNPQQKLTPITSPWPFYKWGIDIAGPFPEGPGKVKFLIVAIDYFTKWIEAKPVVTITGAEVKKFVCDIIVCRFGLPGEIISDNEKQFRDNLIKDWCEKLCIRQCFASIKHPQANGLVERANRSLGERIGMTSNTETSFSLTYGTEAVIPVEIGMPNLRTAEVDMIKNDEALEINLDLLEERREHATI
ncbi:reverse transcriptase domain-containing protein [Tanacetum coccineum]